MNVKKGNLKKNVSAIVALICIVSLLMSGTYAYRNHNQHKTNEGSGGPPKYDVKLVEDFDEKDEWNTGDPDVKKEIRVANLGVAAEGYGSAYVRLQLKEYMEIAKPDYQYSDKRYMIDEQGRFLWFETQEAAAAEYPDHVYTPFTAEQIGKAGYLVATQAGDPNGQYGAFVILGYTEGTPVSLVPGVVRATTAATTDHQLWSNGECAYTIHLWDASNPADDGMEFHRYVQWNLGPDVISLSDWITGGAKPVAKWIYDDRDVANPYAYWGEALKPGETTADLLKSVKLIEQPDGSFYYAIHVEMEAVSFDELGSWTDAPQEITDAIVNNSVSIVFSGVTTTVKVGESIDPPTVVVYPAGSDQDVTWTTGNSKIATVDHETGVVTGVKPGTVQIIATGADGQKNSYNVTVLPNDALPTEAPPTEEPTTPPTEEPPTPPTEEPPTPPTEEPPTPPTEEPTTEYLDVNTPAGGFTPEQGYEIQINGRNVDYNEHLFFSDLIRVGSIPLSDVIKGYDPSKPTTISVTGDSSRFSSFVTIGTIPDGARTGENAILLSYMPSLEEVQALFPYTENLRFTLHANLTQDGLTTENPITINMIFDALYT
ncbi:MAG: Ig-like domain-containing protein [Oscillospiraceae bacterium]|jgi:hypothetical protein|nr:Ig-like domain-containing protein [Oscillospiraceae bacterium]